MSGLTVRIATLDASAESLMGLRATLAAAATALADSLRALAVAAPDTALAAELPRVPVEHLVQVMAEHGQLLAGRVADGAVDYRAQEAALLQTFEQAGGVVPVPR